MEIKEIGWIEFKDIINELITNRTIGDYIFRGQTNSHYELETSFDRMKLADSTQYHEYVRFIEKELKNQKINCPIFYDVDGFDMKNSGFYSFLQHYGYPTPLLDWTKSPYIAAFFAFEKNKKNKGLQFIV